MNRNKDKEKKKITPTIITKPKPLPNSKPVQSSHFAVPISVYYPSGQRILKKKGYEEYNYENFMEVFRNRISDKDFEEVNSNDPNRINKLIISKKRKHAINKTFLHIFETLLGGSVLLGISVPSYLFIQNGLETADINLIMIFVPIALIIFLVSLCMTIYLREIVDDYGIPMEAGNLNKNR